MQFVSWIKAYDTSEEVERRKHKLLSCHLITVLPLCSVRGPDGARTAWRILADCRAPPTPSRTIPQPEAGAAAVRGQTDVRMRAKPATFCRTRRQQTSSRSLARKVHNNISGIVLCAYNSPSAHVAAPHISRRITPDTNTLVSVRDASRRW